MLSVGIGTVLLCGLGVPVASADATPAATTATARTVAKRPAKDTIVCNAKEALSISNPHKSHHQPRNVNVIATVSCSKAVAGITLTVRLYRNGKRINAKTKSNHGKKYLKGNASAGCKGTAGTYQGYADVRVVFPPGYTPPVESAHLKSKKVSVHCWS